MGDSRSNLELSRLRAEAVISYLAAKGIATSRLSAKGYGSSKPLASNDTSEGRELNRRVEYILQGNK
jgi:outer membrane protein OmpA-like peptidoglycan-associated protein